MERLNGGMYVFLVEVLAVPDAPTLLVPQAITQKFFPAFRVVHTSRTHTGQIYIPVVNYM